MGWTGVGHTFSGVDPKGDTGDAPQTSTVTYKVLAFEDWFETIVCVGGTHEREEGGRLPVEVSSRYDSRKDPGVTVMNCVPDGVSVRDGYDFLTSLLTFFIGFHQRGD